MPEPQLTAKAVFDRAHEITAPEERCAYLDQACSDNAELRQRVEALLRAHDEAGSFLDKPAAPEVTSDVAPGQWIDPEKLSGTPLEGVGSRIGPYKLLQQIGEGGMGVVFMAEQQEPVRRMVALKVIKAGMDSAQVIARFEAERQALALMDHPNIAKVLDAGTTASGRPFFVMELVKGIPITKYCDEQRLSPKQRLELFVPVCQAIQHAHQKGIIHRDIKPSNVLIAAYDGKPVPKVIDFGVAKATGHKLTERTLFTGFGGLVGTLEYMSPEQAEFNALDIDTRSDIYSLGVLLYELLTGTTPLSRQRIKDAAILEVLRLIREEEPPRPSTRLSESKDSLASVSAQRHLEPAGLLKALRGEVDWMVMKALEKDRSRRYETANGFARDIQRYLAEEPVEAGPPSATYRLRKLAWKHRRGLTTAAALLLLLVAGVVVSTSLAAWALRAEREAVGERNRALTAEADAKEQRDEAVTARKKTAEERDRAVKAESDAKAVLGFFQDKVLSAGRPKDQAGGLGNEVTLREAVDAARKSIADTFKDRPLVEASILDTLGTTYWLLGETNLAIEPCQRAVALREANLGPDHPDTLTSRYNLANAYWQGGRASDSIRLLEPTLKQQEAQFGVDHPDSLRSRHSLARGFYSAGNNDEAIRLHQQNLKLYEAKFESDHLDTLSSRHHLANAYLSAGRTAEAIRLLEKALKQREGKPGQEHPITLQSRVSLAYAYMSLGRNDEAIPLLKPTLKLMEAGVGDTHPDTISCRNNLAEAYRSTGRTAEAIRLLEQNLKLCEAKFGAEHPNTLLHRNSLAGAYWSAGKLDRSIPLFEKTLSRYKVTFGPDNPYTLGTLADLGVNYRDAGRLAEGIALLEEALQRGRRLPDGLPAFLAATPGNLAKAYEQAGQYAQSEPLYRENLKQARKRFGAEDVRTVGGMAALGSNLLHQHKYVEAEPLLRDCLKIREAKQPDDWATFNVQSLLGDALLGQKKYTDAEPLLLQGYQGMKQRIAKIPPQGKIRLTEALERLVQLYEATGKKEQADKWRKELTAAKSADKK